MMRLICFALITFLSLVGNSQAMLVGYARTFAIGGGGDCDNLGSWGLYYDADHTSGTTTACISGSTTTVTLATGVTIAGTTDKYVLWDGTTNSYLDVGAYGLTTQNGRVQFTITTPTTIPSQNIGLVEWYVGATSKIIVYLQHSVGTYQLVVIHADGSTVTASTGYTSLSGGTEYVIIADWNSITGKVYAKIGTIENLSAAGTISSWTPTNGVRFGEDQNGITGGDVGWMFDDIYTGASQQ